MKIDVKTFWTVLTAILSAKVVLWAWASFAAWANTPGSGLIFGQ